MKKKKLWPWISSALAAGLFLGMQAARDDLIIQFGITKYRLAERVVFSLLILSLIVLVSCLIKGAGEKHREKRAEQSGKSKKEDEKKEQAFLSVKAKLDSENLKETLTELGTGQWRELKLPLMRCSQQLEDMDRYQEKLNNLIVNNGVESLSDTKDVLDQVEQYLCRNIRKVLNYIEVSDPEKSGDVDQVRKKTEFCIKDCEEKLEQTGQFLFTMADFLNNQGDDTNGPEMLELYKNTILESLKEDMK